MRSHELHTSNIANANVSAYKAKKIDFEARLREALGGMDAEVPEIAKQAEGEKNVGEVSADIYEDPLAVPNGSGNTVNMETEQTEIAKNTIGYDTAVQLVNKKLAMQKYVLGEGGR